MPTVCVTRAGAGAGRRPTGKMLKRRKMLGIAPDSPASGARFVSLRFVDVTDVIQRIRFEAHEDGLDIF